MYIYIVHVFVKYPLPTNDFNNIRNEPYTPLCHKTISFKQSISYKSPDQLTFVDSMKII